VLAPAVTVAQEVVLAHYGGVPEALTIGLPIAIFVGFMLLEKRARQRERERVAPDPAAAESSPGTPPGS
jgi:hypothetical protein